MIVGSLEGQPLAEFGDVGLAIGAAIDGEVGAARAPRESARRGDGPAPRRPRSRRRLPATRVLGDPSAFGVVDPVHRQQVGADDGTAMGVRAGQHDAVAVQSVPFLQRRADPVREVAIDADQIKGDRAARSGRPGP